MNYPLALAKGTSTAFMSAPDVGMFGHDGIWHSWTFMHSTPHALFIRGLAQAGVDRYFTTGKTTSFGFPLFYSSVSYFFI